MEETLDSLTATAAMAGGSAQFKAGTQQTPKARSTPAPPPDVVDLGDDDNDDSDEPTPQPKKRTHAEMDGSHEVFHSEKQFMRVHRKPSAEPSRRSHGAVRQRANSSRPSQPLQCPPPQPLRVTPIMSRNPSPERVALLGPVTPVPHVPQAAPTPFVTPIPPGDNSRVEHELAARLRKDRQAFYLKAASAARAEVKMDTAKPPLRPPVQPPGMFHLLQCGFLKFDLECGSFPAFQEEVEGWRNDPSCMDRFWAAYGRFHGPSHQVNPLLFYV